MKTLLLLVMSLFSVTLAHAAAPNEPHLYVQGTAKIEVKPDSALVSIAIEETQPDIVTGKSLVDAVVEKVITIAKHYQINEKHIYAEQLNVFKHMEYDRELNQSVFKGFRVTRNVKLKLDKLEKYPKLLQALVDAGVTEFQDTQLLVSNHQEILRTVEKAAIKDARMVAKELARDFDVRLGNLYSVSFEPFAVPSTPYRHTVEAFKMSADPQSHQGAYNTGVMTIEANVYAIYLID
ncbi:Protein of unknown function DUF541 [Pseudoalteromonas luteoviolacea B = ATCC 29581]|nr:Protein of unknown function DUF541 [Pseudoalteromonas luteoviolacea B = ATCC 29581]